MWRSIAVGVVLAGVLAGCSLGKGAVDNGGGPRVPPNARQATSLVRALVVSKLSGSSNLSVNCRVKGRTAHCTGSYDENDGNGGALGTFDETFRFQWSGSSWMAVPVCSGGPSSDPFLCQ
jgi:hypothetical protein